MITSKEISDVIFLARRESSKLAVDFVNQANYGMESRHAIMDKMKFLKCHVAALEGYIVTTSSDVIENGVMTLSGNEIVLSPNNSLSLESEDKKIPVSRSDINCISEEDIYTVINKIKALCSDC